MDGAWLLLACLAVTTEIPDSGTDLVVGHKPPPLIIDKLLQAPRGTTVEKVQAGPSVVEFWATWCGPCVEQMPHFNALVQSMEGRPLSFLSITAEAEDKVTAFLQGHPLRGVVGLEGKKAHNWGVRMLPTTVLVDAQGKVAAVLQPDQVTPRLLEQLLKGEPLVPEPPVEEGGDDALLRSVIWVAGPNDDDDFESDSHHLEARRTPLRTLVAYAHGVEPWQVELGRGVEDRAFHVSISMPSDASGSTVKEVARETLAHALNLRFSTRQQQVPVTALVKAGKRALPPAIPKPGHVMQFHPGNPSMLLETVQPLFKTPLVDESGLESFELMLHDAQDVATVRKDVSEQLGMQFVDGKRKRTLVRVEKR